MTKQAAALKAEACGIRVVMNRCPKMEYDKHSGEWQWIGGNTGLITSKRQKLHASGRTARSAAIIRPAIPARATAPCDHHRQNPAPAQQHRNIAPSH